MLYMQSVGFWRSSNLSIEFHECPNPSACIETRTNHICAPHYIGPLCKTCDLYYEKSNGDNCAKCSSTEWNIFYVIILSLTFLIYFTINIKSFYFKIKHYIK